MIKLDLPPKPDQLTKEFQEIKTQEFLSSGKTKNVWKIKWLKDAVYQMAFGKCCYSEIRLVEESKYMEVEHYAPKSIYPDKVMEWGNLLPSCKKCNGTGFYLTESGEKVMEFLKRHYSRYEAVSIVPMVRGDKHG